MKLQNMSINATSSQLQVLPAFQLKTNMFVDQLPNSHQSVLLKTTT
jgi:hypothetical protein